MPTKNPIQVFLRLKPSSQKPETTQNTIKIGKKIFTVDKILSESQQSVFLDVAKDQVLNCFRGLNSTIFAYGQTGSGKTYTIQGTEHNKGLIPRVFHFIFQCTQQFKIKISLVEIYNENIFDLFDSKKVLEIREDINSGIFLENLSVIEVGSYEEAVELYNKGILLRSVDENNMNKESSRSHSIMTIWYEINTGLIKKNSRMNIIDLAGSERIKSDEKFNVAETGSINKSLLCLSEVIKKLGDPKISHINYRDSKLTFLLKDSLGGNSKLAVIGNINTTCISETLCTLRFLTEVKKITNIPSQNAEVIGNIEEIKKELTRLDDENQELKIKINLMKKNKFSYKTEKHDKNGFLHIKNEIESLIESFNGLKQIINQILTNKQEQRIKFYKNLDKIYMGIRKINENNLKNKRKKTDGFLSDE